MPLFHAIPAETALRIPVGRQAADGLEADLVRPDESRGLVLFAHGSGSGRRSARNRRVARSLQEAGLATVLMDLLTPGEERIDISTFQYRFDIPLLAGRLEEALRWLARQPLTAGLPAGLFGASTGAAAALIAAADLPGRIAAVVSRGGRPDLAGPALPEVEAPTLLIVGGDDATVMKLNEAAYRKLSCVKSLATVPGAGHLFEEPGALETASELASRWFTRHFSGSGGAGGGEEPGMDGEGPLPGH